MGMNETERMPRCTLTLVDSAGDMKLYTHGRRPRGTDSISATPKGFRAYATVTDPLTGGGPPRIRFRTHTHIGRKPVEGQARRVRLHPPRRLREAAHRGRMARSLAG